MKRLLMSALLAGVGFAGTATAQDSTVYIIHGINGIDLGENTSDFLVDIQLNDAPLLAAVPFGVRSEGYELTPGTYNIKISPADLNNPYSQPPVLDLNVDFLADENSTVIAHLREDFSPTASKFVNDLSPLDFAQSRVGIHHTAAAPAVDVDLDAKYLTSDDIFVAGASNGAQANADVDFGFWRVNLFAAGTQTRVFRAPPRFVVPGKYYAIYFVGSLANDTFQPLVFQYR